MKQVFLAVILFFSMNIYSQEYIKIIRPDINIRMLPSTSSPIIGHAFNGEIYITNNENLKWYSVLLPSGESRWIYKKLANKILFNDTLSKDWNINQIQEELKIASDRANKDSNEEIIDDLNKIEINNILFDRYILLVLQSYKVSPLFYEQIINYTEPLNLEFKETVAQYLVSVSHIDYDLFKIDLFNYYIETRRCFKLGSALDAMIFMYYQGGEFIQKLCFEDGYGKGFENCYNIKNTYSSVLQESNLVVLTTDGKMKKTNLVLKEAVLDLPDAKY